MRNLKQRTWDEIVFGENTRKGRLQCVVDCCMNFYPNQREIE